MCAGLFGSRKVLVKVVSWLVCKSSRPRAAVLDRQLNLLGRNQIKLARGFGIKQSAFLLVAAAAPVFMPAGDAEKVARAYALLASFVLVEIGTFNAYDPYIGGMGVPA